MIFLYFFFLGFFSLLSQVVILKEFIISFEGNELGISLFYFFWFLWIGTGAIFSFFLKEKNKFFLKFISLYPLLSLGEYLLFVNLKKIAKVFPWELFPFNKVIFYLALFLLPFSFFTGFIFNLAIFYLKKEEHTKLITKSYFLEALGSFFAGILSTLLMAHFYSSFKIIFFGAVFFLFINFLFLFKLDRKGAFLSLIILFIVIIIFPFVHYKKDNLRFFNLNLEKQKEIYTPYQHLLKGTYQKQILLFSNGKILISFPEMFDTDKEASLLISVGNFPKKIFIFGEGNENLIISLLKFPIEEISYCILDRIYFNFFKESFDFNLDNRLKIIFKHPHNFLEKKRNYFDLIVINLKDPTTLFFNNFFTKEFYLLIKEALKKEGFLATSIHIEENFLNTEIKNYASSIYYTLKEVFPLVLITPQVKSWFFAGDDSSNLTNNPSILEERFKKFKNYPINFSSKGFYSIFLEERIKFIEEAYQNNYFFKENKLVNSQKKPLSFFLNLLIFFSYFSSFLVDFLKIFFLKGGLIIFFTLIFFFILHLFFLIKIDNQNFDIFNIKFFQFISGFWTFSFYIILIYLFQIKFGLIFYYIGLFNGFFMLGLALGAPLVKNFLNFSTKRLIKFILFFQIIFTFIGFIFSLPIKNEILFYFFYFFTFFAGILGGSSYPICAEAFKEKNISLEKISINLILFDHLGAALSALFLGFLFFPTLGLNYTFFFLIMICFLGLVFLWIEKYIQKEKKASFSSKLIFFTGFFVIWLALFNYFFQKENLSKKQINKEIKNCSINKEPFPHYFCSDTGEYIIFSKDLKIEEKGFAGPIEIVLRLNKNREIEDIKLVKHQETLSYLKDLNKFLFQFKGAKPGDIFSLKDNNFKKIDAMTGATVSSEAILKLVNKILLYLEKKNLKERYFFKLTSIDYILIIFVFLAFFIYFYRLYFLRKFYLFLNILFLGFIFNLTFSFFHLFNFLKFNVPSLIFILPVVLTLFLNNFWCAWICPFGALQEVLFLKKLSLKAERKIRNFLSIFKYFFLIFLLILFFFFRKNDFSFDPLFNFFFKETFFSDKILGWLVLIFSLFFLRLWCRYFCAIGAFFLFLTNLKNIFSRNYIRQEENEIKKESFKEKKGNFYLVLFFIFILSLICLNLNKNFLEKKFFKKINIENNMKVERIKGLIKKGKLSNKEASFYKIILK